MKLVTVVSMVAVGKETVATRIGVGVGVGVGEVAAVAGCGVGVGVAVGLSVSLALESVLVWRVLAESRVAVAVAGALVSPQAGH